MIDTGAPRTLVSWNDAKHYEIDFQSLPLDNGVFTFIGGVQMRSRLLPQSTLIFMSDCGEFDLPIGDLRVADSLTTTGESYPPDSSILGLDILEKFDLLFDDSSNPVSLTLKIR